MISILGEIAYILLTLFAVLSNYGMCTDFTPTRKLIVMGGPTSLWDLGNRCTFFYHVS
jgi:hypothetical protein